MKKLVMIFKNEVDKQVSLSLDNPKDTITESEIKSAMDLIVEKNIFKKNGYYLVATVEAQIVDTQSTEYDLVI